MAFLDRVPWGILVVLCVGLGLAPFLEEPHLVEKTRLLVNGELTRGIDRIDLVWHVWPWLLVALKGQRQLRMRSVASATTDQSAHP